MARLVKEGFLSAEDEAYLRSRGQDVAADRLLELYGGESSGPDVEEPDAEEPDADGDTYDDAAVWKVSDLRDELTRRNEDRLNAGLSPFSTTGKREELVARLREDDSREL